VRPGSRNEITIYVETSEEFFVPLEPVRAAHDGKLILGRVHLDQSLLNALAHAHDAEVRGL
jgi:hypothetical protein